MTTSLKKRPWLKFFPADWRADPRLRMCSLAARGLWIDLIAYMHEGEPYGHLTIDGKAPNLSGIAALVARPAAEVKKALRELEEKHVTERTDEGVIYSRRMVRDFVKALRDHHNGNEGGNPNLSRKDKEGVIPPDKAQKLETRSQRAGEKHPREGEKIPEDWKPSDAVLAKAMAMGLTDTDIAKAVTKFAGNHRSKGTIRVNWDAAFEVWCINDAEKLGRASPVAAAEVATTVKVHVKADTPQWKAWCKHLGKTPPQDKNFGWYFDTEWPPDYGPQQSTRADAIPGAQIAERSSKSITTHAALTEGIRDTEINTFETTNNCLTSKCAPRQAFESIESRYGPIPPDEEDRPMNSRPAKSLAPTEPNALGRFTAMLMPVVGGANIRNRNDKPSIGEQLLAILRDEDRTPD